jgi:hypothetical protein
MQQFTDENEDNLVAEGTEIDFPLPGKTDRNC